MKVKLSRALHFGGVRSEAGAEMDVSDALARELIARGCASPVAAPAQPAGPMTTDTAGALVEPVKEKKHARS